MNASMDTKLSIEYFTGDKNHIASVIGQMNAPKEAILDIPFDEIEAMNHAFCGMQEHGESQGCRVWKARTRSGKSIEL